jgi:hypothetical protein
MDNKIYLYDAFGELIFLVAMADSLIQPEETAALDKILANHPWTSKNNDPEDIYKKVIMAPTLNFNSCKR